MLSMLEAPRRTLALFAVLSLIVASACGDDGTPPEPEPDIAFARVTVGTNTVEINNSNGIQTPASLPLTVNSNNAMSVRFLGDNQQDEPIVAAERANLELRVPDLPTGWTFTFNPGGGSGATFTATIRPTQTGSRALTLQLFSTDHDHEEFERTLTVNVQ
jgi:hypothetical protein